MLHSSAILYDIDGPLPLDTFDFSDEENTEPEPFVCKTNTHKTSSNQQHTRKKYRSLSTQNYSQTRESVTEQPSRECTICLENTGDHLSRLPSCGHSFCKDCLNQHVNVQLESLQNIEHGLCYYTVHSSRLLEITSASIVVGVKCPHSKCQEVIRREDLHNILNAKEESQVEDLLNRKLGIMALQRLELDFHNSLISYECLVCQSLYSVQSEDSTELYCSTCEISVCGFCLDAPHEPISCADYKKDQAYQRRLKRREEKNETKKNRKELLRQKLKSKLEKLRMVLPKDDIDWLDYVQYAESQQISACPNCRVAIEKNGGCDHMKCSRCGCDYSYSRAPAPTKTRGNHMFRSEKTRVKQFYFGTKIVAQNRDPTLRDIKDVEKLCNVIKGSCFTSE